MAFYADMQQMARDLLKPDSQGGLGQGTIEIVRVTTAPGENPWDPSTTTTAKETLRGAAKGISKELIGTEAGGTVILASDREVICEVPKSTYKPTDALTIDGKTVTVLSVQKIPAAGIAAAVKFIVRG